MSTESSNELRPSTEKALEACGRDRVFHRRSGGVPAVAIRWDQERRASSPDGEAFLVVEAETRNDAGRLAAQRFAIRLREIAQAQLDWALRIETAIAESGRK